MIHRIPHESYLCLMLIRGWAAEDIQDELGFLRLPPPDVELLGFLERVVPRLGLKKFKVTRELRKWADEQGLDYRLLNVNSKRVQNARSIRFNPNVRHILELCLLNPRLSWHEIFGEISNVGKPEGLSLQVIKDYSKLFWDFSSLSPKDKSVFFAEVGTTAGMRASMDGFPTVGLHLDYGVPIPMSEQERLEYMRDVVMAKFSRDGHSLGANAHDISTLVGTVLTLEKEIRRVVPPVPRATVVFDAGDIDMIPSVDHLCLDEEPEQEVIKDARNSAKLIQFSPGS